VSDGDGVSVLVKAIFRLLDAVHAYHQHMRDTEVCRTDVRSCEPHSGRASVDSRAFPSGPIRTNIAACSLRTVLTFLGGS
jgi:hypothetical protein